MYSNRIIRPRNWNKDYLIILEKIVKHNTITTTQNQPFQITAMLTRKLLLLLQPF